jgi:hypothetical protein
MDKGWVEMEVQNWHLHCCVLFKMFVDQTFEKGAWFGGRKGLTCEGFNFCKKPSTSKPCQNEFLHSGKCHGRAKAE